MYSVSDVVSYDTYKEWGCLISEPRKYIGTHILFWVGLILYYVVTAWKAPIALVVITVVLNLIVELMLIILAFTDPGMIPKVLVAYEKK